MARYSTHEQPPMCALKGRKVLTWLRDKRKVSSFHSFVVVESESKAGFSRVRQLQTRQHAHNRHAQATDLVEVRIAGKLDHGQRAAHEDLDTRELNSPNGVICGTNQDVICWCGEMLLDHSIGNKARAVAPAGAWAIQSVPDFHTRIFGASLEVMAM